MSAAGARCTICTSKFSGTNISALPCGHTFHFDCVSHWLRVDKSKSCPNCRTKTLERNIVKQLYFDCEESEEANKSSIDDALKVEQLSLELHKQKDENLQSKEEIRELQIKVDSLCDKLHRSEHHWKKRVPLLEAKNRQLEMMVDDQEELRRQLNSANNRLKASEFYKIVIRGRGEEAITAMDKYVNSEGDIDLKSFLVIKQRQVEAEIQQRKKLCHEIKDLEKTIFELRKADATHKSLIQLLKKEVEELRLASHKTNDTPYNPKLKSILQYSSGDIPKRPSLGFNETIDLDEQDLKSCLSKQSVPIASTSSNTSSSPSFHLAKRSSLTPETEDSDIFDELQLPQNILNRVKAGAPRKPTNPSGAAITPQSRALAKMEYREKPLAPRPLAKSLKRKMPATIQNKENMVSINSCGKSIAPKPSKMRLAEQDTVEVEDLYESVITLD